MDEVLHADDAEPAEGSLDQVVGGDGGAVTIDLKDGTVSGHKSMFKLNDKYLNFLFQTFSGLCINIRDQSRI